MPPVSAGEICTIQKAKDLGLYNVNEEAFIPGLENMRTYTSANPNDYKKDEALCRISGDGAFAYPLCPIQQGFAFTHVPGDPSRCRTASCPTGFALGPGQTCVKPIHTMFKERASQCEERPTDWYSIPYYHLGNGYTRGPDGKCYEPCMGSNNEVPLVGEDPVDKVAWGVDFTDATVSANGTRCTALDGYFGGKYKGTDAYCPTAVIKRLATGYSNIQVEMKDGAMENMGDLYDRLPSSMKVKINSSISADAVAVGSKLKTDLANIKRPTRAVKIACERAVEPDEMSKLYATCVDLKNRPGVLSQQWRMEDSGITDTMIKTRRIVMEQACHEVFCNNPHNASGVGGQPVCFSVKKASDEDLKEHNERTRTVAAVSGGDKNTGIGTEAANGSPMNDEFVRRFGSKYIKIIMGFLAFILTIIGLFVIYRIGVLIFGWNTANLEAKSNALTPQTR
jgi:hypothetical protein